MTTPIRTNMEAVAESKIPLAELSVPQPVRRAFADVHTHILPGIDDGAKNSTVAARLLQTEKKEGVSTVVLTPHFDIMTKDPEEFLRKRDGILRHFEERLFQMGFRPGELPALKLGCELTFPESPDPMLRLRSLCAAGTDILLMELPYTKKPDARMFRVIDFLMSNNNIRIAIAHIERYQYVKNAEIPRTLREMGCFLQMNIGSLRSSATARICKKLLSAGLVDFFGSDCHNPERRPPNWTDGLAASDGVIGRRGTDEILRNGKRMFEG